MKNKLKELCVTTWPSVFQTWKDGEGGDLFWQKHAVDDKGWDSWELWRSYQSEMIGAEKREWKIYEIPNPNEFIPALTIGPFKGWQNNYPEEERNKHTFHDLVRDHTEWVESNSGVRKMMKPFSKPSQFIGLYVKQRNQIILYEGHHRSAAISLAVSKGDPLEFTVLPTIAITEIDESEIPQLLEIVKKGTNKPE